MTMDGFCTSCGLDHSIKARLARLRKALPATKLQLVERYPCVYANPDTGGCNRMLDRDLRAIGAVAEPLCGIAGLDDRVWSAP